MAIACYAPVDTDVSNNFIFNSDAGILLDYGVTSSTYTGSPFNSSVSNNKLNGAGDIVVYAGTYSSLTTANKMVVNGNKVITGQISLSGSCNWIIDANSTQPTAGSTGFTLNYYNTARGSNYQTTYQNLLRITDNTTLDKIGRVNTSITNLSGVFFGNLAVYANGNNFNIPLSASYSPDFKVGQIVYTTIAGLGGPPYGVEYKAGTLIIDTDTPAIYLVTVSGSRNRGVDTYAVNNAAIGEIRSTSLPWTNPASHHVVGQAITLTDGVITHVTGYVGAVRIGGGVYYIDVVDATGSALNLGTLGSGTITATNPLTFVTV